MTVPSPGLLPLSRTPSGPSLASTLASLSKDRLLDLARLFDCDAQLLGTKDDVLRQLSLQLNGELQPLLQELGRDELRAIGRRHDVDVKSPSRMTLIDALLRAAGLTPQSGELGTHNVDGLPLRGQIVQVRHRQWLVEKSVRGEGTESPLVCLVCLDDDDPGRTIEVLWELELGARVVEPAANGLGECRRLDPPHHFGAYLHALKWSAVSAANAKRFQAPFRAGLKLMAHQLTPLMKALELPRSNLFIADDVGLGKTIEAGLVLQELLLRSQVSFVLIVCPASVCIQWQGEMQRRFGLRFEVMTKQFVMYRRQDRGFGTNAWGTHNRFIISHALLRRPEYLETLRQHLGDRISRGLLILDEAHVAAPASGSKYAVDTDITRTIRDLAPRFDNRLFLSATPHNGHSNSFAALLEILDPVRFTRGLPVNGTKDLREIMVRRLKRDLRKLHIEKFPRRMLVEQSLRHDAPSGRWSMTTRSFAADATPDDNAAAITTDLGPGDAAELALASLLAEYTEICAPAAGQARLVFINLQKRLLSSPEAFARTLEAHQAGLGKREMWPARAAAASSASASRMGAREAAPLSLPFDLDADPEAHGPNDDDVADQDEQDAAAKASALEAPGVRASELLQQMASLAERARYRPDGKMLALFSWLRTHLCAGIGEASPSKASAAWKPRRVILFTEYADTKRYVLKLLRHAVERTDRGDERVLQFHGGMGDDARDEVQRAFNAEPLEHPVRILIATDAAREGVNLQGFCYDLIHLDIPWNPGRMEQRNGRIDRTLQSAESVYCQYFIYPDRPSDVVLATALRKVNVIQNELGSMGTVLLDAVSSALESFGLSPKSLKAVEAIGASSPQNRDLVNAELEGVRSDLLALQNDVGQAEKLLEESRKHLEVSPEALRAVVNVGLDMSGAPPMRAHGTTKAGHPTFTLPTLDNSWRRVLDTLRPTRKRGESYDEWRRLPPRPVTFHPLETLTEDSEQLHLAHPLVKRILDRFLAQGFGAHDLSRITAVVSAESFTVRVVAFARLTLFGNGGARLHDEIVALAAPWPRDSDTLVPYKDTPSALAAIAAAERLLTSQPRLPNAASVSDLTGRAPSFFASLWPHLHAEADTRAIEAKIGLNARGRREADALRTLLLRQAEHIDQHAAPKALDPQLSLDQLLEKSLDAQGIVDKDERRQAKLDADHLKKRRARIDSELVSEPLAIQALYDVRMTRLTPVGLVIVCPESMS